MTKLFCKYFAVSEIIITFATQYLRKIIRMNNNVISRLLVLLLIMVTETVAVTARGEESRQDSALCYFDSVEVALLTCEPHDEVYSLYGHTAIRITDRNANTDIAVNYGIFNSKADFFVPRFVFGLTDYMMGVTDMQQFLAEYDYYGSGVMQQRLNMTAQEKQRLLEALRENALPENVVYRYNFFYNNCTTKARDMILDALDGKVEYKQKGLQEGERSFRDLIHSKAGTHRWAAAGNDLLLGVQADENTTFAEREFLPQVLMIDFDDAVVKRNDGKVERLVGESTWLLPSTHPTVFNETPAFPLTPMQCASVFFCVILALCVAHCVTRKKVYEKIEYGVVCVYGLAGLILLAMVFSQHPTVRINFQILVLNPLLPFICMPRFRNKYTFAIVTGCLVVFFVAGFWQRYAEGMYLMALSLQLIALTHFFLHNFGGLKKNH